jgi:hypothetical protein
LLRSRDSVAVPGKSVPVNSYGLFPDGDAEQVAIPMFLFRNAKMDRRGFLPTFSTGSARKGTRTFQKSISGRVTKKRGFRPLAKPLFHLNSQFSARSRYHSITLEKTVSNPRAIKTTPIAMRKLSCLSDTSSITADPARMTISPIEPRILYRLNQSGIAGSPYNRFDMLPSRWTFRSYGLFSADSHFVSATRKMPIAPTNTANMPGIPKGR